jgi:hypothetical protein
MPRPQDLRVRRVNVEVDELGEGGSITAAAVDSRNRRLHSQTELPNSTFEHAFLVGATRWGVDITCGHQVPCCDGRRGPSAA